MPRAKRTPKCCRCRNHGFVVPVKGHAGKCRWKRCVCDKCHLITQRRKVLAAQKALQKQDPSPGAQGLPEAARAAALAITPGPGLVGPWPVPEARCAPVGSPLEWPPLVPEPVAFQPVLLGGRGHVAPIERPEAWTLRPWPGTGPEQLRGLPAPVPRLPFGGGDFGHAVAVHPDHLAGYPKQCPGCPTVRSYHPASLENAYASPALGIAPQRGFQHVISCCPHYGGSLASAPAKDFEPSYHSLPPLPPATPPPAPAAAAPPSAQQQPQFLPPGFLSLLHVLPPPPPPPSPPPFALALSESDKEDVNDQDVEAPREPRQLPSQEQSD